MSWVNDTCGLGDPFWTLAGRAQFVAYDLMPPFHLALGLLGHTASLLAFYKQSMKDKAYSYQVYSTVSQVLHVFALTAFIYTFFHWSGVSKGGPDWFVSSYGLMWYAAHLTLPTMHAAVTNSLLASLCMAIDRTFAMSRPFKYATLDHSRNQSVAFSACALIGVFTSIFDFFRMFVVEEDDGYLIQFDYQFSTSRLANVCSHLRNVIRILGVLALITCNVVMVHYYRKRVKQVKQLTRMEEKERNGRTNEKVLALLTGSESTLTSMAVLGEVSLLTCIYTMPFFTSCGYHFLMDPIVDAIIQISNMAKFYIALVLSRQFRKVIFQAIPCVKTEGHS